MTPRRAEKRCQNCNKKLCEGHIEVGAINIKCAKCGVINTIQAEVKEIVTKPLFVIRTGVNN